MHDAVLVYVARMIEAQRLDGPGLAVLDLGGRDVNGTTRHLFNEPALYVVVDITPHETVDVVADAADLNLGELFDVVISTECLEHTARASEIVLTAARHLKPGGTFIATMAGPGRRPHGAHGAELPEPGEFYCNVEPSVLDDWLAAARFNHWTIDISGLDLRCIAVKMM